MPYLQIGYLTACFATTYVKYVDYIKYVDIFSYFSTINIYCGYSLEAPHVLLMSSPNLCIYGET